MTSPESNYRISKAESKIKAAKRWPTLYDFCPSCGELKSKVGKLCVGCTYPDRPILAQPANVSIRHLALTRGYFAVVPASEYERCSKIKWSAHIKYHKDGTIQIVYAICQACAATGGVMLKLHRFVLGVTDPAIHVDHIDHDGLNCDFSNLRTSTPAQDRQNSLKYINNTSGYKGVSPYKTRHQWRVCIGINGKQKHLGYFALNDLEEAARCYDTAATEAWGDRAHLNFPQGGSK